MKLCVLGGTGSIGSAIVKELKAREHTIIGLSRSQQSDEKLRKAGAQPLRGDLLKPEGWVHQALSCDVIIQAAATFEDDMAEVDGRAMAALIKASHGQRQTTRLLYTGGCWLYGDTGGEIATEASPFKPIATFAATVQHAENLLAAPNLATAIIHPAMVYHADGGGVFSAFTDAAKASEPIEIWGSPQTHWPLIEREDLARIYADLAERPDLIGHFNAVAEPRVAVGDIARTIARAYGAPEKPIVRDGGEMIAEHGAWAEGPTLNQAMSGDKIRQSIQWTPKHGDYKKTLARHQSAHEDE